MNQNSKAEDSLVVILSDQLYWVYDGVRKDSVIYILSESLILAQDERWRRA